MNPWQVCYIAEELLKTEFDACRIEYNRFISAISFKPTIATVLSPDVRLAITIIRSIMFAFIIISIIFANYIAKQLGANAQAIMHSLCWTELF